MITQQLPSRKSKWSSTFLNKKVDVLTAGEQRRRNLENERRGYLPQFQNSNSVTRFVDRERELEPVPFIAGIHGSRNSLCAICNLEVLERSEEISCDLCPAVAHSKCSQQQQRTTGTDCCLETNQSRFTHRYRKHVLQQINKNCVWCCVCCSEEIVASIDEERSRLRDDRFKRLQFFAAMRLQASCMRHRAQKRYKIICNGILRLQARCRGAQMRKRFIKELSTTQRSFKIKNCEFELEGLPICDAKSTLSCIIHVISDEHSDLEDSERQLYRFDTHGIPQRLNRGRWNDTFLVHSCNTMVKLVLTVHAKDHETSSSRGIFLGQYVIDARKVLTRSFFTGKPCRLKGVLSTIEIEPRDQRFSFLTGLDLPAKNIYGDISFELHPLSNVESKCGIIEEVLSTVLKGARKKYFAVLSDKHLYLYFNYGDSKPKISIYLGTGTYVSWFDDRCEIIKLDTNNQTWLFACNNSSQLHSWYNKLSGAHRHKLEGGVKAYRSKDMK